MKRGVRPSFGSQLKSLRESAGYTQEELATIAGLSVHAVSALERGERRRPQLETLRALSAALELTGEVHEAFMESTRTRSTDLGEPTAALLPLPLTALVGREADMRTLRQWLADPGIRLVTLVGSGGVGKTRLALQLAHLMAKESAARVTFVPLATIRDSTFVAQAIGDALGLADVGAPDLPGRLRSASEGAPVLLVLDNCEHVLDAVPLVAELLTTVRSLRILATSRASLRVRGEREYAVGPLALSADEETSSSPDLARSPAVRLFVDRAAEVRPDFRLTAANAPIVAAICRRLDALPLAIELAARWMKFLTVDDLRRRLDTDVLLSAAGLRDLPERQQTMNATVAWSYQLLEQDEQRAFRRFGVLPSRFSIDAAAEALAGREDASANADRVLRAAAGLIDKSLLSRSESSAVATRPLYYMLETVRAYASLELAAAGERDDAMEGLVRYCIREASLALHGLVGVTQVEWLNRVQEDVENYRGALAWLIARGRSDEACDIAWPLLWFWAIRGHATEGLRWYTQILNLPSLSTRVESRALVGAAAMSYTQGDLERARTGLTRALMLARRSGHSATIVQADWLLGHVEHAGGNLDTAQERFERSLEGFRAVATPWGTGVALLGMARVALATGDADRAEHLLDQAAATLRNAGPWFLSRALYVRAILAVQRGNADTAIALVRESLTHIRALDDKLALVYALVPLAAAAALNGNDAWAARILGARDAVTERTGTRFADTSVREIQEQAEQRARARLGPQRWSQSYAAGRKASIDSLLSEIDRILPRRT